MIVPGVDVNELYDRVIEVYEEDLSRFSYKTYIINEKERVYVIQDAAVIYLGLIDMWHHGDFVQYFVVFEELILNESFKFKYSANALKKRFGPVEQLAILYVHFHGDWAKPIREIDERRYNIVPQYREMVDNAGEHYYIPSKAEYVNETIPELKLKDRFDSWEGFLYHYIFYEFSYNNEVGYASIFTSESRVHQFARTHMKDIEKSVSLNGRLSPMGVSCDAKMIELFDKRRHDLELHPKEGKGKKNCFHFYDGEIQYFYIPKYVKSNRYPDLCLMSDILYSEILAGKYNNLEKYDYYVLEYKWKSEQQVLKYTQLAFSNYTVFYQHRPYFLKTDRGQLSYDVFICELNIAIEYQGKQHFEPVEIFGGKDHFIEQQRRDALKRELSIKNGVRLVYINYWEDISIDLIKNRVNEALMTGENHEA